MNRRIIVLVLIGSLGLIGCSGKFWGGALGGAGGAGAGYEYKAKTEMDRIDEMLENGDISQEEYDIRKDQIERGSIVY